MARKKKESSEPRRNSNREYHSRRITSVAVEGYKSFYKSQPIEIAPLTILAGANSSGKSSAIQPLLLLKQTLEAAFDPGGLLLDGPNARFTTASQMLSRTPQGTSSDTFSLVLRATDRTVTLKFKKPPKRGIEPAEMLIEATYQEPVRLSRGIPSEELEALIPESVRHISGLLALEGQPTWSLSASRGFLQLGLGVDHKGSHIDYGDVVQIPEVSAIQSSIRSIIHVPGFRGDPARTHRALTVGDQFPGTFEPYAASIVWSWQESGDPKLNRLAEWLQQLGLTWRVQAKRVDDTRLELRVARLPGKTHGIADMISIADVGFGVSQTVPVLVALLTARTGQIVYVEQPEIHLHPRAQARLADIFAEAISRGVCVVAETHSSLLLLAVQTLVAEGKLRNKDVRLHWFQRDRAGATLVQSADLDEAGRFGPWPEDFASIDLEQQDRYLSAIERVAKR